MKAKILFCKLCFVLMAFVPLPVTAINSDLLEMSEQFDRIDKQDFQDAIERATSCTRKRDFSCAEAELSKAAKVANDGKDERILLASRQSLADEKQELANEKRRAEEARRREEEEERQRVAEVAQAERRRQQEADESRSSGFQWGKTLVMLGTGAVVGGGMSSEAKNKFVEGVVKDSMPGQKGISNTTANANAYAAKQKQQHNEKMAEIERARKGQEGSETERRRNAEPDRARVQSTPSSNIDNSWQTCGDGKKIAMLSGVREYGPYQPSRPMCESECVMPSGAWYHDTTLPNDMVYMGTGRKCNTPCNINNSCG